MFHSDSNASYTGVISDNGLEITRVYKERKTSNDPSDDPSDPGKDPGDGGVDTGDKGLDLWLMIFAVATCMLMFVLMNSRNKRYNF